MKQTTLKFAGVALAAALAITARADVAIHQNVSVYGYAAGSASYNERDPQNIKQSDSQLDLDAAKLGFAFNFSPVTAKLSVYTDTGASELYLLEANATYDLGNGASITGGRFQSWLGYEAFDVSNTNFITYGQDQIAVFNGFIPSFHEGVKIDYAFGKSTVGFAVVNSIYNGSNKYSGDGSLSDGYGLEGHYGYNDGALSVGATIAYQNAREGQFPGWKDIYAGDVWAQYTVQKTTFGGEVYWLHGEEGSADADLYYVLAMVKQQINDKFSLAGRVSYGKEKDWTDFWKLSGVPSYDVTKNLTVRAEVSYTKYEKAEVGVKDNLYAGVQAIFKF